MIDRRSAVVAVVVTALLLAAGGCEDDGGAMAPNPELADAGALDVARPEAGGSADAGGGVAVDLAATMDGAGAADAPASPDAGGTTFVLSSLIFGPVDTTTYVSVLDSLGPQTIDYKSAHEFSGAADTWVYDGSVFVTNPETKAIRKFSVESGRLNKIGEVSFLSYGPTDFGFWRNVFVSSTKAYFINGAAEYILWNPATMTITGTVKLPVLPPRDGLEAFPGYSDRAAALRNGRLYQPVYWTDKSYFKFTPDSRIVVFDVTKDALVEIIEAPCPGLDYATVDDGGDLYFSSWVYAAGGALVLKQPATCVFKIPAAGPPAVAFTFPSIAGGRQGAALRYIGGGRALLSVLHGERATISPASDPAEITFGANWRFWTYDLVSGAASPIEAIDWNAGAQYTFDIDQKTFMLVAAGDYSATKVYDLGDGRNPNPLFDTRGWAVRLFKVR